MFDNSARSALLSDKNFSLIHTLSRMEGYSCPLNRKLRAYLPQNPFNI